MSDSIIKTKKLINPVRRIKPGEDIKYLLLVKVPNTDETYWEIIKGREELYNYIKANILEIDVDESYVIANGNDINLDSLHTVYGVMKWIKQENDIVDEFDIDDYLLNNSSAENIGIGLETGGNVFTGVSGSYDYIEEEE